MNCSLGMWYLGQTKLAFPSHGHLHGSRRNHCLFKCQLCWQGQQPSGVVRPGSFLNSSSYENDNHLSKFPFNTDWLFLVPIGSNSFSSGWVYQCYLCTYYNTFRWQFILWLGFPKVHGNCDLRGFSQLFHIKMGIRHSNVFMYWN